MSEAPPKILVIDDDLETCNFLREIFEEEGWSVSAALQADSAIAAVKAENFALIVSDLNLNDHLNGIELLKTFRRISASSEVILISGFGTLETAIEAVREGAFDFISKPFNLQEIISTVRRALEVATKTLQTEAHSLRELSSRYASSGLIGHSRQMIELYKEIARVTAYRSTVLIMGESGTGKELVARAIHKNGPRASLPFIAVNCGALTETLLEAELFGHMRGSFTGAVADKKGLFEEAEGGTLFLDEIGETDQGLQVKLLRALQESEIRRVGSSRPTKIDVRVIAATNRELEGEVKAGRFREDLYYRLSVITLNVPPLRERREDIPMLTQHFLRRTREETGKHAVLSEQALNVLINYEWSGNVRELENSIEHAVLHSRGQMITPEDLPVRLRTAKEEPATLDSQIFAGLPSLEEMERRYLLHVLEAVGGNRTRAAEILQIDRRTLYRMAERFKIKLDPELK
ncbi:MAG TPA: sigma-54 dependent transcriptional regulator [Blastocatellia bacterium]|nr:sigma-54 dependent transcriptional regulator [Blastocatellia bacterium]